MSEDRGWHPTGSRAGGEHRSAHEPDYDPYRPSAEGRSPYRAKRAAPAPGEYDPYQQPPAPPGHRARPGYGDRDDRYAERAAPQNPRPSSGRGVGAGWSPEPPWRSADGAERHSPPAEGTVNRDIDLDEVDPSGRARRAAAQRAGNRRGRPGVSRKKALKWASLSMVGVLVAVLGVGVYLYLHFNANIKSTALLPSGVTQAPEIPNKFGQTAMNILLLGNGGRVNAADCKLGGACTDTATVADTLMVVHLAADRSNMTVMSIPRDTVVNLPACAHDATDLINASLNNGPSCAVQAVHDITGLTIDHFVEVDMSGVVTMSNALGGVPVCVTNNLYDSYSHLKLPKGTSVLQGTQALAWLRTRHAFINEVYREQAQHMFLSALLRKMQANASLTHVTTLYGVADAATKALTVDSGLGGVLDLLSLAQEIGKVPTSRVTMLSTPTVAYAGSNRAWSQQLQLDTSAAPNMFAALKSDTPYTKTTAKAAASAAPSTAPGSTAPAAAAGSYPGNPAAVNKAGVSVAVQNGTGVSGRAGALKTALVGSGFSNSRIATTNASSTAATALYYPSTKADSASAVAAALGIPASAMHQSATYSVATLVIGTDWTSGTTYGTAGGSGISGSGTGSTGASTAVASSPPAASLLTNGADTKACMYVPQPEW